MSVLILFKSTLFASKIQIIQLFTHSLRFLCSSTPHPLQQVAIGPVGDSLGNINVPSSQTLLIRNGVSNNFSLKQRGEDNSLFTKNIITYMHRSNNSSPYPMFERLFAVI